MLASHDPGILEFTSDQGPVASGSQAFYTVYVITQTGNEKGGKSAKVVWP